MAMSLALKLIVWSILTLALLTTCRAMQQSKSAETTALNQLVKAVPKLTMNNFETWKHQIAMAMMMISMSKYLGMDEEFDQEDSDEDEDINMETRPSPIPMGGMRPRTRQPLTSSRTMPIPDAMAMRTPNNRRVFDSITSLRNRRNETYQTPAPPQAPARKRATAQQQEAPPTARQKITAYSIMWGSLSKGVQQKVRDVKMPNVKKLWLRIKKIFVQDNHMEKHRLTEEFCSQKLKSPEKFDDFVCEIDTRAARLQTLGKVIDDNDKIAALYAGIRHEEMFTGPIQNLQLDKKDNWLEITDYLREVILYEKMKHGDRKEGAYAMTIQRRKSIYQGKGEYDPKDACRGMVSTGKCSFGDKCFFNHDEHVVRKAKKNMFCTWCMKEGRPDRAKGHHVQFCRSKKNQNSNHEANSATKGCFKCGDPSHQKWQCPKMKGKQNDERKRSNNKHQANTVETKQKNNEQETKTSHSFEAMEASFPDFEAGFYNVEVDVKNSNGVKISMPTTTPSESNLAGTESPTTPCFQFGDFSIVGATVFMLYVLFFLPIHWLIFTVSSKVSSIAEFFRLHIFRNWGKQEWEKTTSQENSTWIKKIIRSMPVIIAGILFIVLVSSVPTAAGAIWTPPDDVWHEYNVVDLGKDVEEQPPPILDSGATTHLFKTDENFLQDTVNTIYATLHGFSVGSGRTGNYTQGTCMFDDCVVDGQRVDPFYLENALCAPYTHRELVSVAMLDDQGCTIIFRKGKAKVYAANSNQVICSFTKKNGLYFMDRKSKERASCLYETNVAETYTGNLTKGKLWHQRLGHWNYSALKRYFKWGEKDDCFCPACSVAKASRRPYKGSLSKAEDVMDVIVSDVCGPWSKQTKGGKRYFVLFIDKFSKYTWIALIRKKSEVTEEYKRLVTHLKNVHKKAPNILFHDYGGEYRDKRLEKFCEEMGTKIEYSSRDSPDQNAVVERRNGMIKNAALAMMYHAGLSLSWWGEAVVYAVYILNRLPTKTLGGRTPLQVYSGILKPDLDDAAKQFRYIFTFGCRVTFRKTDVLKGEYPGDEDGFFTGVDMNAKAFRIVRLSNGSLVKTRDVTFNETDFPNKKANSLNNDVADEGEPISEFQYEDTSSNQCPKRRRQIFQQLRTKIDDLDKNQRQGGSPSINESPNQRQGGSPSNEESPNVAGTPSPQREPKSPSPARQGQDISKTDVSSASQQIQQQNKNPDEYKYDSDDTDSSGGSHYDTDLWSPSSKGNSPKTSTPSQKKSPTGSDSAPNIQNSAQRTPDREENERETSESKYTSPGSDRSCDGGSERSFDGHNDHTNIEEPKEQEVHPDHDRTVGGHGMRLRSRAIINPSHEHLEKLQNDFSAEETYSSVKISDEQYMNIMMMYSAYATFYGTFDLTKPPHNIKEMLNREDKQQFLEAMGVEWKGINDHGTLELVPWPKGKKVYPSMWIFDYKYDELGLVAKFKARLLYSEI